MSKRCRVAILVEKDYQDMEVWYPFFRLQEAGHEVVPVGVKQLDYKGKYGYPITCQARIDEVRPEDFDGVIIPGGWAPDFLRLSAEVLEFVRAMQAAGKVVAAICHAGWVLASAKIISGRQLTSYIAIKDDLEHAGATWIDAETVVDGNLITARTPADLPAFVVAVLAGLDTQV